MDLSKLADALILGVSAGLQPTATQAVKDAYETLKTLLQSKYKGISSLLLRRGEVKAISNGDVLARELQESGAQRDPELARDLLALIDAITTARAPVGVDLSGINALRITLSDIISSGTGAVVKNAVADEITISGIRAGVGDQAPIPRNRRPD